MGSSPTSGTSHINPLNLIIPPTWSADLAYVIGLIATDGNLSSDGRHITMTSKDLELIETVKRVFGATNKVGITRNRTSEVYRVQIGNVALYKWLVSIGLFPNKSKIISEIKIPQKFIRDFLRGHLDGDGSIFTYTDRYNAEKNPTYVYERLYVRFLSGSKNHIEWINKCITEVLEIDGRIHKIQPNKNYDCLYILKFAKKNSIRLLTQIYYSDDISSLSRKRLLAEKFLP